jgi:hypothetical protein
MKSLIAALFVAALGGCGLETVGAAATGAAIKKQELEQGKKTLEQTQQKIGQAMELQRQQEQRQAESAEK